jgi:hypothetical protein
MKRGRMEKSMTIAAMGGPLDPKPKDPREGLLPAGAKAEEPLPQQSGEPQDSRLTGPEEAFSSLLCGRNRPPKRPK